MLEAATIQPKSSLPVRWGRGTLWFARKHPVGFIGGLSLLLIIVVAVIAPLIEPYNPVATSGALYRLKPPGTMGPHGPFILGTDLLARDVLSRILGGARVSLEVGIISVVVGVVLGTVLGVASGYIGGNVDLLFQRVVDTALGFPGIILAMLLITVQAASLHTVIEAIAFTFVPRFIRLSRATALSVKEADYVVAAKSLGASGTRIMFLHVLPNSITSVIVLATALLGTAIVTEASLSFLGLGVPPPNPSWGSLLNDAEKAGLESAPWMAIFPGLALSITVFGFNLFGDAIRDVLDPRLRGA